MARCNMPVSPPSTSADNCISPPVTSSGTPASTGKCSARAGSSAAVSRRSAAKNNLHPARPPVPGHGEVIVQRPVFVRRTRERLKEQSRPGNVQMVFGEDSLGGGERSRGQGKLIFDGAHFQPTLAQQEQIPIRRMQLFVSPQAARVGPLATAAINRAPALGRACQPGEPGGFAIALQINHQRKFSRPQPADQPEEIAGRPAADF